MNVHELAASGFQKGNDYDDNRPTYTDEAATLICQQISQVKIPSVTGVDLDVLELGAGTGLFTRKLQPLLPKTTRYLATDPSEGFLEVLKDKCPTVATRQCAADSIPLKDNSVKVVICAQCFHWFATTEALNEIRRVLVEGGKLILIWNAKDQSVPWLLELMNYLLALDTSRPVYCRGGTDRRWRRVIREYPGFKDEQNFPLSGIEFKGDKEAMVKHFSSISVVSALPEERKQKVVSDIEAILQKHPATRDNPDIDLPFITDIYIYTCLKT